MRFLPGQPRDLPETLRAYAPPIRGHYVSCATTLGIVLDRDAANAPYFLQLGQHAEADVAKILADFSVRTARSS